MLSAAIAAAAGPGGAADIRTERPIGPGVKCITLVRERGPWVIQVIEADGESGYVRPGLTFAADRGLRAAPVRAQAERATTESRYPIAGINGDFFAKSPGPFEADPVGALVAGGEVISTPYPRSALLIGPDGRYAIRRLRLVAWLERSDGERRDVVGLNQPRGADTLVLYSPRFGESTRTNGHGVEVTLTDLELPLRLGQTYRARAASVEQRGDSPIPLDGVVLSGHGALREFLRGIQVEEEVQFRLEFEPPVSPDTEVIGGGPALLREGRVVVTEDSEGFRPDVVAGRAPRTAVGFNGRRLLLVTVDGRQPGISIGMTLAELAELMRELGCTDAMNLDGGGSTTAWVRGAVINRPSDGGERRVANSLFLFSTAPKGPPMRLMVSPEEIAILAGASCPVTVTGAEDEFYNPVAPPAEGLNWRVEPEVGTVTGVQAFRHSGVQGDGSASVIDGRGGEGRAATGRQADRATEGKDSELAPSPRPSLIPSPDRPTGMSLPRPLASRPRATVKYHRYQLPAATSDPLATAASGQFTASTQPSPAGGTVRVGVLNVEAGKTTGTARVRVYARPPRLEVTPTPVVLTPGVTLALAVRAVDELGRPLITEGVPARWSCPPELGRVDETGLFQAAEVPARGELTVEMAGTRLTVPVVVGMESRPLDGFEQPERWTGSTVPPGVKGTVSTTEKAPREGRRALRLEYDFRGERATRAIYATANLPLGRPAALRLWVRGDGGGGWLRARLRDPQGRAHIVEFSRDLGRLDDWLEFTAPVSVPVEGPLTLEALYLAEPDPQAQTKGAIELDGLAGEYAAAELARVKPRTGGRPKMGPG